MHRLSRRIILVFHQGNVEIVDESNDDDGILLDENINLHDFNLDEQLLEHVINYINDVTGRNEYLHAIDYTVLETKIRVLVGVVPTVIPLPIVIITLKLFHA